MEDHEIEIFSKTKESLLQMLDLNMSPEQYLSTCRQETHLVWKVLILDEASNQVLAPLIHITDLRLHNIPLYLSLSAKREPLRSLTILYLIEPTLENVQKIIEDCRSSLYDNFQINFLYPPAPAILEALASGLVEERHLTKLHRIYEQHLRYIVLEPNLFSLTGPSFEDLNMPGISDEIIENNLSEVAMSLFCVMKTCKFWPIIKAGKGLSEVVAQKLAELCWEQTEEINSINRPLLLILDRTADLSIMLHHPWSYQPLLLDVFQNSMNKIVVPTMQPQVSELDKSRDVFWLENCFSDFDQVLQSIDKQFNEWKAKYDKIGDNLVQAFENVEELTEKKGSIDLHMMLATELVKIIKSRHLDMFNEFEGNLLKGKNVDLDEILQKISDLPDSEDDKLRLLIINYLSRNKDFEGYPRLFEYLRHNFKPAAANEGTMKSLVGFAGKMKDKLTGHEKMLPITRTLHLAMENKDKDLEYLDSKFRSGQRYKREFSEAIIFIVGGGCYTEYQNLMQYGEMCQKRVIYSATSMNSPNDFLQQIRRLSEIN